VMILPLTATTKVIDHAILQHYCDNYERSAKTDVWCQWWAVLKSIESVFFVWVVLHLIGKR
jgi:hypothetical protein